ncbi:LysR family transcriptional regulator [Ponticaulis sp.]|uniref:LysR family transcriptional regulator n=1 Tax=Ponticaulis sp. TaxID=2020902 RepID=UPI000B63D048|nr:LysR family transcriptional regulator [Ponticaulis sp.]MAI90873.1 LysR family transcriptional regulator [Ponticaulis sp.]OUX98846.1 MAG: LysR family transcriptional regulator [Hyphomonadaceae bacterium TMED5]|tara:strand:+ start:40791 stop:41687 length:897 start_codon:yes stop_codon:yes gene_type:complete
MDWDKLRSFHAAAETGSLTAAGERLKISQSAVSRQISALEAGIGVPLFQRHARGLVLTDAGIKLHAATAEMARAASVAGTIIKDAKDTPQGDLVITAPIAFGSTWLIDRLQKFTDLYPQIHLHLYLDDREYDLLKLEAECAIRLWAADKADLIQRKLMSVNTSLYASPDYLEKNGMPEKPQDLDDHRIIVYGEQISPMHIANWAQRVGRDDLPPRAASLTVNNVIGMVRAAEAGLGVADLPDYMIPRDSNLVKVLPEMKGPHFELFFIYPSDLRKSNRIAAFRDFLTQELATFPQSEN